MPHGNVLVVEDDESIRRLLIEVLTERAMTVDGARDGADALHHVSTRRYAVVILDLMMPYMSGVDFLDSLQALMSDPSIKSLDQPPAVLVITGAPPETVPADGLEQRFPTFVRGVLRKPLDVAELASCVESLLA